MPKQNLHLIHADVIDGLKKVPDGSIDLVLSSPPYNLGKVYEIEQIMTLQEYTQWLEPVVDTLCKKLKETGSICWQVGNYVHKGQVVPLDVVFYSMFAERGMKLRNRIIWRYNFGLNATKRLSGRYETLLWFTKSDNYTFNLDSIRVPQLYPGKKHSSRKGAAMAGKPSGNPRGKNPSDFWTFSAMEHFFDEPVWDIPNVKANHVEQTIHPCQFPHELAERCILAFTSKGDMVLDPFVGAGTTAVASLKLDRRCTGIDKSKEYIDICRDRVNSLSRGEIKLRKSGQKIKQPSLRESVARRPIEWEK